MKNHRSLQMTKEEQNQIIKDKWVEHLQREDNIPESIGDIYKNWLLGKIQEASNQLIQKQPGFQTQVQEEELQAQQEAS